MQDSRNEKSSRSFYNQPIKESPGIIRNDKPDNPLMTIPVEKLEKSSIKMQNTENEKLVRSLWTIKKSQGIIPNDKTDNPH